MARWKFWAVAFAFLVVMMLATLPSPLYGLYRTRDHLSAFTITAVFVGLSVPVIGAGIALDAGVSTPNTVLGFAIFVALGVSVSGWALLGRRPVGAQQASTSSSSADSNRPANHQNQVTATHRDGR
jgi:hypothetical protein